MQAKLSAGYYSGTQPLFCRDRENEGKTKKGVDIKTIFIGLAVFKLILAACSWLCDFTINKIILEM